MQEKSMKLVVLFLFGVCLFVFQPDDITFGKDQDYPAKPINFLIPFPAGSTTDLTYRAFVDAANKHLPQPLIPINKVGGGGTVAAMAIAQAKPDGYTIGGSTSSQMFIAPFSPGCPYKGNEFTFIANIGKYIHASIVRGDAPWKTWEEFANWAKEHPGETKVGLAAARSVQYSGIILSQAEMKGNLKFTYIPFKSGIEAFTAMLGGHITLFASTIDANVMEFVKSGKARLLAFQDTTVRGFENYPTLRELYGLKLTPNIKALMGPKGLPDPVVKKLEEATFEAIKEPNFVNVFAQYYMPVVYMNSRQITQYIQESQKGMGEIIGRLRAEEEKEKK